ncbi:MAG: hypothetical protein ABI045_01225 [Flavobacteriales bacterium]
MENLDTFFHGWTILLIAHWLSTVKNADQIVVLDHGKIIEIGPHKNLVERRSPYYHLLKKQLELRN